MRLRSIINTCFIIIAICFGLFVLKNSYWIYDLKDYVKEYVRNNKTKKVLWNRGFERVVIKSSIDQIDQKAYFYGSTSKKPMPLIVSLHTWSGNYQEFDSIAILSKFKNLNYIHPDFRGANRTPDACNSKKSIRDIDDAINYAFKNSNVDKDKIYILGKSGGGYAAIGAYMKSNHKINTVAAWVPITDISKWYTEGQLKKSKFINDILQCTSSNNGTLNQAIAKEKSPIYWSTPISKRKNTKLHIYTGINDGLDGSVPITHSIDFYNKIIYDYGAIDSISYITKKEKDFLVQKRAPIGSFGEIENRQLFLKKEFESIKLIIFEGNHEMLTQYAFKSLANK